MKHEMMGNVHFNHKQCEVGYSVCKCVVKNI